MPFPELPTAATGLRVELIVVSRTGILPNVPHCRLRAGRSIIPATTAANCFSFVPSVLPRWYDLLTRNQSGTSGNRMITTGARQEQQWQTGKNSGH